MRTTFAVLLIAAVTVTVLQAWPEEKEPANLKADLQTLVEGNNLFAFDLYRQLAKEPGNKFFSPYSISTALAMTYGGARGDTAKEMAQTLHFTLDNERLHSAFGKLTREIQGGDKKRNYELTAANSLWGNKTNLSVNPEFLRLTKTEYQAGLQTVNFLEDPEGARRVINGWVEDKTNKKITDFIKKGSIKEDTRLILVNAIYFKGDWRQQFPIAATLPEDFTIPGPAVFKVPMMNGGFIAPYMENTDFQLAQFMYTDDEVSMVVIVPRRLDGLAEVEKNLSAKTLAQSLQMAKPTNLAVKFPKFKMSQGMGLKQELTRLGAKLPFDPLAADFSAMEAESKGRRADSLYLVDVLHGAFVEVDEKGTEAAAVTATIGERPISSEPPPQPPRHFHANHPFLFLLRHNKTGTILFFGRVSDPRQQ